MIKKHLCLVIAVLLSAVINAQTTNISFSSEVRLPIFEIERLAVNDSSTLLSSIEASPLSMTIIGISPFNISVPNGGHIFNISGFEEYNKSFYIDAQGNDIKVKIYGDPKKAKAYNYWTIGLGFLVPVSVQVMLALNTILDQNSQKLSISVPAFSVGAFLISFGMWIGNIPRVEIKE